MILLEAQKLKFFDYSRKDVQFQTTRMSISKCKNDESKTCPYVLKHSWTL